jgi:hypothetical protein
MAEGSRQDGGQNFEITDAMVAAAAHEICEAGITPYPAYPEDYLIVAREILEAAFSTRQS